MIGFLSLFFCSSILSSCITLFLSLSVSLFQNTSALLYRQFFLIYFFYLSILVDGWSKINLVLTVYIFLKGKYIEIYGHILYMYTLFSLMCLLHKLITTDRVETKCNENKAKCTSCVIERIFNWSQIYRF